MDKTSGSRPNNNHNKNKHNTNDSQLTVHQLAKIEQRKQAALQRKRQWKLRQTEPSTLSNTDSNTNRNNHHNNPCRIQPKIKEEMDVDVNNNNEFDTHLEKHTLFNVNNIAITSLTSILEYINVKFLYMNVCRVCKYWHSTVTDSDFIFGYFRKTVHENPAQPLTLQHLKSYKVAYIKQELKARKLKVNGKKSELVDRLHQSIRVDAQKRNIKNQQSISNRKRLILFVMKKLISDELFCQNCHKNWTAYFNAHKQSTLTKKSMMKRLGDIHMGLRICQKCQNLLEYQDVNTEHALRYYGLSSSDFERCGVLLKHGRGQMVHVIESFSDDYSNAYVCEQIAKMKYSKHFKRRTIEQEKELAEKARGLLQRGERQKYIQIYAPTIDFQVDRQRFEFDELLYNASL